MNDANHPTPLEVLRGARELLSDPKRWAKKWFAKGSLGFDCDALSPDAVCWCVAGAIERVAAGRSQAYREAIGAFVAANHIELPRTTEDDEERDELQGMLDSIGGYNDESEHAAIVRSLEAAIAAAEAAHV
jgi:hypothetical protein